MCCLEPELLIILSLFLLSNNRFKVTRCCSSPHSYHRGSIGRLESNTKWVGCFGDIVMYFCENIFFFFFFPNILQHTHFRIWGCDSGRVNTVLFAVSNKIKCNKLIIIKKLRIFFSVMQRITWLVYLTFIVGTLS